MLKLDTDMIMVGLLQISSGRTQREKMAFCLGDRASFPVLSLWKNIQLIWSSQMQKSLFNNRIYIEVFLYLDQSFWFSIFGIQISCLVFTNHLLCGKTG